MTLTRISAAAKDELLDGGIDADLMSLHDGDPGAAGTDNELSGGGYARQSCTFSSASSGERVLAAPVDFSGPALADVTHIGIWRAGAPATFLFAAEISGDAAMNADGEYRVTTATMFRVPDPS